MCKTRFGSQGLILDGVKQFFSSIFCLFKNHLESLPESGTAKTRFAHSLSFITTAGALVVVTV